MTEVEWKLSLSADEHRRLLLLLGPGEKVRRTRNRYWETQDHALRSRGAGLRLRQTAGRAAVLTFKYEIPNAKNSRAGVHRRGEVECAVRRSTVQPLLSGKISPLDLRNRVGNAARKILGPVSLVRLGDLSMERRRFHWKGFLLEVDRFTVHGKTYYEVEVEHRDPNAVKRHLAPFFRQHRIRWTPKGATKVSYLYGKKR